MMQKAEPMASAQTQAEVPASQRTRTTLNVSLLVGTLMATTVFAVATYIWHSRQVDQMASVLVQKAEVMEKAGERDKAAEYLRQYLGFRPYDAHALARLAEMYDQPGQPAQQKMRAVQPYYRAIGALGQDGPSDQKHRLRCRLTELLLELSSAYRGCSTRAEQEARLLLEPPDQAAAWRRMRAENPSLPATAPQDKPWWMDYPKLWTDARAARLWVLAMNHRVKDGSLAGEASSRTNFQEHFEQALALNPGNIELSTMVARLNRDQPQLLGQDKPGRNDQERQQLAKHRAARADVIMNDMVAANPTSPEALLARHHYRVDYELPGAGEDLDKALEYGPDRGTVLLAAAQAARKDALRLKKERAKEADVEAKHIEAFNFCRRAIDAAPAEEGGYLLLGEVCQARGRNDEAIEAWQRGLAHCGQQDLMLNSRLMEALVAGGRLEEARKHLDAVDRQASELAPMLNRGSQLALLGLRDLLRGEWLVGQGRYSEAVELLRRATTGGQDSNLGVAQVWRAWQLLGSVYAQLGQWDLAATAHESAARLEPQNQPPEIRARTLLAAANAWNQAGCAQRVADDCQQALEVDDNPQTWLALAAARLQHQIGLPPEERKWDALDEALNRAKAKRESLSEPWRLTLLEVDSLLARSKPPGQSQPPTAEAANLLRQAEKQYPHSQPLLELLVPAYETFGLPADADRAMDALERLAGQSAATCVVRSRLHSRRKQYEQARQVLAGGLKNSGPAAHVQLEMALVQVDLDEGQLEVAYRRLAELYESSPQNIRLVWQLARFAIERNDLAQVARWENQLRELEGPDGSCWRCARARRLLAQAKDASDPVLTEVAQLEAYLQSQRPGWPEAYVLAGLRYERLGRHQQAIDAYRQAIQRGEQRISVYQRLISLLYQKRDFDQARRYLSRLQDYAPASQSLSGMDVSVAAHLGDNAGAMESARRGVQSRPQDPMARIWLAQMLLRSGQPKEAEAALAEAARLAPDDSRLLDALFGFYVDTGQADRARESLQKLAASPEVSQTERILVLARGYDRIGDRELAKKYYGAAAQQAVDDPTVQKRLAGFLFESDPQAAEEALRRALRLAPEDREVRRALAYLLAARGGAHEWQEIQQLLSQDGHGGKASPSDQRLEAQLLARRGGKENLGKARQLLEQLIRDPEVAVAGDHLLLASLYEREGKIHQAEQQFNVVAQQNDPETALLTAHVEFLLRHERLHDAERALDKLDGAVSKWLARPQRQEPSRESATSIRIRLDATLLRAKWLKARGRIPEVQPLVDPLANALLKQYGDDPNSKAHIYRGVGDLYAAVDEYREAEHWYQLLAEAKPGDYEPLVTSRARQGRIGEAIETCLKAAQSDNSARPAIVLAKTIGMAQASADDFARAEPVFSKAVQQYPGDWELLSAVGYVRFLQKRNEEAIQLYERALAKKPQDLLVLNNLATLLAEQPARHTDALEYIEKAIAVGGPAPAFLDVKGTILALDGKAEQAVPLLEEASSLGSDPRFTFHLAVAYQRMGNPTKAREALAKAQQDHLKDESLTEMDKRLLAELEAQLAR